MGKVCTEMPYVSGLLGKPMNPLFHPVREHAIEHFMIVEQPIAPKFIAPSKYDETNIRGA